MKKKLTTILLALGGLFVLLLLFPNILIKPLTKKEIQIKCVEKDSRIRLTKRNRYYIIANHGETKEEKFEIQALLLESNKGLFNNFQKDSTYVVTVHGFKLPFFYRSIGEIIK